MWPCDRLHPTFLFKDPNTTCEEKNIHEPSQLIVFMENLNKLLHMCVFVMVIGNALLFLLRWAFQDESANDVIIYWQRPTDIVR